MQRPSLPRTTWALIAFVVALLMVLLVAVLLGDGPAIPA
jgi:hypothetical protein